VNKVQHIRISRRKGGKTYSKDMTLVNGRLENGRDFKEYLERSEFDGRQVTLVRSTERQQVYLLRAVPGSPSEEICVDHLDVPDEYSIVWEVRSTY